MQFEGTTYRPPVEADTMLLQVTVGCAHNKCTYCNMYRDVKFRIIDLEQIEKDLREARQIYRRAERIFLVNGDAFVLPAKKLLEIAGTIRNHFPECHTITMYASINNIKHKSNKDLQTLKKAGINDLYMGIESGWDKVLQEINKGNTVNEARKQLYRLNEAGINHMALLMLGVAGSGNGIENAQHTAYFLNQTKPKLIWAGTLAVFEGTELHAAIQKGDFLHPTELEILEEEKELIRGINLKNVPFYGIHPTNVVPIRGVISKDTDRMIETIENAISEYGVEALSNVFQRTSL
ncbi:MAG: radical SAM protein [Desulfobacterium sp.]|jgi:radical SAM superfamily enzyme YgiQ (UPF0313 family)|nr:radical SAM protein [Desulfobacterium sp.]